MTSLYPHKFKYKLISIFLVFVLFFSSFSNQKVDAIGGIDDLALVAVVGVVLSACVGLGCISGNYEVTAKQIGDIKTKLQTSLASAGDIDQFNNFGTAVKNGAQASVIKGLARGTVIYSALKAISSTLFPDKLQLTNYKELNDYLISRNGESAVIGYYGDYAVLIEGSRSNNKLMTGITLKYAYTNDKSDFFSSNYNDITYSTCSLYNPASHDMVHDGTRIWKGDLYFRSVLGKPYFTFPSGYPAYLSNAVRIALGGTYWGGELLNKDSRLGGYTPNATIIANAESVTLPVKLLQDILDRINTWDGVSPIVLAPPLPYDIPTAEGLVINPSYTGEEINPPKPTVDPHPEEGNITLPWLAGLLGLLGLGKLTGIDAGVKSGIDSIVDSITHTAQDVFNGVRDWAKTATASITSVWQGVQVKVGEIAGVVTGSLVLGIDAIKTNVGSLVNTISHALDPPTKTIDLDKLKNITLFNKFPFSIPSDLNYLFSLLASDPIAPKVDFPFNVDFIGGTNFVQTVDLSPYDNAASVVRGFEFMAFVFMMVYVTKNMIWK